MFITSEINTEPSYGPGFMLELDMGVYERKRFRSAAGLAQCPKGGSSIINKRTLLGRRAKPSAMPSAFLSKTIRFSLLIKDLKLRVTVGNYERGGVRRGFGVKG
ncbi:hypothetical protein EVAR_16888_1 [Eumeta japonica]|uniref:Uncharacterized protein n=1 Tax=Eumeta variegata TaxID=151549 RepID=A0A4C1TWB3_EUMVA|nr:hypothetical protein EVAR_16888_1 [Eumeta japonica]